MAVELNTLPSNNINNIDTNFQRVEVALQDAVSRSGNGPNQLTADLDANSQNLLNINRIDVQEFYMNGQPIASIPAFEAIVSIADDIITVAAISDEVIDVAANAFNINTVGNNIVNVNTVANNITNINTAVSSLPAINTVNANSTNINTVASNIANVNTVAVNIGSVNSVAANIVNVNTVALNNSGINTVVANLAAILDAPNQATAAANSAAAAAASAAIVNPANFKWLAKAIGEFYEADDGTPGVDIPPQNPAAGLGVWIELTAGLTGSGQFNNGKLSTEVISGSSPLVSATAVITASDSPMNGQTIRLLNTERRMLRPGSPGTLQDDAMQGHRHATNNGGYVDSVSRQDGSGAAARYQGNILVLDPITDGVNGTPRIANETRVKNIGVRIFRKVG